MPLPIILGWALTHVVAPTIFAGAVIAYFWDEILDWAARTVASILDTVHRAIEVTSDAIASLVREGRRFYKKVELYKQNVRTGQITQLTQKQEIPASEVPDDVQNQLQSKLKMKVGTYTT